jgi:ketosteroid isomerase-like protein
MTAADWIEGYKKAWESNAPDDIRALFTEDATYAYHPGDEPVRGIDAIVQSWIESADAPGDYTFEFEVLSDDGELAFVQGVTDYSDSGDAVYDNLWVIRFAPDGRARAFTEWYVERKAD